LRISGSYAFLSAEEKIGLNTMISDKFSLFGTFGLVSGDSDTDTDDDLSNFIYSLGGAYSFTDTISLNVKLVNGSNGINGQDEVLRIAGRWTFLSIDRKYGALNCADKQKPQMKVCGFFCWSVI